MNKILGLSLGLWLIGGTVFAQTLTLEDYLKQVQTQGPNYQSAQAAVLGLEKQSHQQDLIYSPVLVAAYNHTTDNEQPNGINYPNTQVDTAGVSITDKLPFGPTLSLGYAFTDFNALVNPALDSISFNGTSFGSIFPTSYYQIAPIISLSVPLLKDFGGAQTAAGVHMVQYQMESAEKSSAYQREQVLYNSKVAYWNLALAQESIGIYQDTLNRSQEIYDWTEHQVKRNLAEEPDALQAEASVKVAALDLQMAQETEKTARLQFNRYRDQMGDAVPESLESLDQSIAQLNVALPEGAAERLDLKAAEDTVQQQKAAYDQANQNIYPDISLNASWRGNGLDPAYAQANQTAWEFNYPTWTLGAQFNLPLDVFTASTVAEGYKKNYDSAVLNLKDKQVQVGQDWAQLRSQLQDVNRRLDMTADIEQIQKTKADEERKRLEYGRTTEFQLLSFENDYNTARLNHLSVVFEKLSILAQAQWWLSTELHPQGENQ